MGRVAFPACLLKRARTAVGNQNGVYCNFLKFS